MEIQYSQLTVYEAERFHKDIVEALEKGGEAPFVIDFKRVEKTDLCCIQILLAARKFCRAGNREFRIIGADAPKIRQAFSMLNLQALLEVPDE